MSLVFQMISAGKSNFTANQAATTSPVSMEGTASLIPFAQALIQKMTGNTESNNGMTTENGETIALLQGLLKEMQPSDVVKEESAFQSNDLLVMLSEDIKKIDESIDQDPALLASLQGWLMQVSALLQSDDVPPVDVDHVPVDVDHVPAENTAVLSPLAQNPETLRFAVQDDLNRLVSLIQEAVISGNEELTTKGLNVLNQFSEVMKQSAVVIADKSKVLIHQNDSSADEVVKVIKNEASNSAPIAFSADSGDSDSDLSGNMQAKVVVNSEGKKVVSDDESSQTFTIPTEENEIVTVGQLSMRNGISTPLKAEAPLVPIQQFTAEMTGLITSKLEIVNKGGIAEATISLFPENLGQVDVKITMQNGQLIAQFVTQNAGTKDLLEQQMVQLRAALQSQGLQVEKMEVTQNNTPLQSQMQQEGRQSGTSGQQSERRSRDQNASSDAINAAELNGEWQDWLVSEQPDNRDQSGSFSVKA